MVNTDIADLDGVTGHRLANVANIPSAFSE